jgi:hypothetical protein
MGNESLMDKVRDIVAGIAFKLLLWSLKMTANEYWDQIYWQEVEYRNKPYKGVF